MDLANTMGKAWQDVEQEDGSMLVEVSIHTDGDEYLGFLPSGQSHRVFVLPVRGHGTVRLPEGQGGRYCDGTSVGALLSSHCLPAPGRGENPPWPADYSLKRHR